MTPQDQRRFFANENGDPLHAAFDKMTLAGEFWQVNLCQALIDYFAVVIEKRPVNNEQCSIINYQLSTDHC